MCLALELCLCSYENEAVLVFAATNPMTRLSVNVCPCNDHNAHILIAIAS